MNFLQEINKLEDLQRDLLARAIVSKDTVISRSEGLDGEQYLYLKIGEHGVECRVRDGDDRPASRDELRSLVDQLCACRSSKAGWVQDYRNGPGNSVQFTDENQVYYVAQAQRVTGASDGEELPWALAACLSGEAVTLYLPDNEDICFWTIQPRFSLAR